MSAPVQESESHQAAIYKSLSSLQTWPKNYRRGDTDAIARSIARFGFNGALRVWQDDTVIAGNHAKLALDLLRAGGKPAPNKIVDYGGEWLIPCIDVSHMDEDSAKAFAIADNHTQEMGTSDDAALASLLQSLSAESLPATGYDDAAIRALVESVAAEERRANPAEDAGAQIDRAAELQEKWATAVGQVWVMGNHRLAIGDCRNSVIVGSLMAGEWADAVVTDSPYGMNVEGVENDDEQGLRSLFDQVLGLLPIKHGVVVNFQGARLFYHWIDAVRAAGHKFERALWLYKPNDGTFPWRGWLQTGQIILLSTVGAGNWGEGEYKHDTYVENFVGKDLEKLVATPKPLDVICHIVSWCSQLGSIVYEPFAGGGTTLIACERNDRKCRAIDLSPLNAAVTIQRWVDATGREPSLCAR